MMHMFNLQLQVPADVPVNNNIPLLIYGKCKERNSGERWPMCLSLAYTSVCLLRMFANVCLEVAT